MLSNSNNILSPIKTPRKMFINNIELDPDALIEIESNKNLDKKWRDKAERELGETTDISYAKIKQLRHLLAVSDNVPRCRRDDAFLLRFLRAKKFDVDKTMKMMQKYYAMKAASPELFRVSPPSQMQNMLEMQIQCMLPLRDSNGRQLYIFRVEKCDPYKCPVESVFRSNVLALETAVRDPETQIAGLIVLLDMSGLGFGHAKFLSPHLARRTVEVVQEAFPMRFKAFHVLHEPFYFDAILAVLKPFLKEKIRRRIHLHGNDVNSLYKHIPRDILPAEYGGTQLPFDNTEWRRKILDSEDYYLRLESYSFDNKTDLVNGYSRDYDEDTADGGSSVRTDTETEDSEFDEDDDEFNDANDGREDLKTPVNGTNDDDNLIKNNFELLSLHCEKDVAEIK